jgi:hypothetical protein
MSNRYKFSTKLSGYIRIDEDGGKFNNRSFSFTIPPADLEKIEADRSELISWIKSRDNKRLAEGVPIWDENGVVKYSYGAGDGSRKPRPEPVFVDTNGDPVSKDVLKSTREGTKVNIIIQQKPYAMGTFNTSLRVIGVQIVELVTGNGAVDSGDMSVEDVAAMFGSVDGFKASEPAVRDDRPEVVGETPYDF